MIFLINLLGVNFLALMLFGENAVSFGLYDIEKSLTPLGWAVVIILPIALIFGLIYLAAKTLKKTKSK